MPATRSSSRARQRELQRRGRVALEPGRYARLAQDVTGAELGERDRDHRHASRIEPTWISAAGGTMSHHAAAPAIPPCATATTEAQPKTDQKIALSARSWRRWRAAARTAHHRGSELRREQRHDGPVPHPGIEKDVRHQPCEHGEHDDAEDAPRELVLDALRGGQPLAGWLRGEIEKRTGWRSRCAGRKAFSVPDERARRGCARECERIVTMHGSRRAVRARRVP
jgi:hypothetical protein